MHDKMLIEWSEEQNCYVVRLPGEPVATGATYEEAKRNGQAYLDGLPERAEQVMREAQELVENLEAKRLTQLMLESQG